MPDRAQVHEVTQIGVEALATPGTAVAATKLLQAMHVELAPMAEIDVYGPQGQKYPTVSILNKEWAGGRITGKPTYTEMVYPLASALTNPTISTPGGAALARDWDFAPSSTAPDVPRTFTVEKGVKGALNAERAAHAIVTDFGATFSRNGGVDMSGALIAQRQTQDVALSTNEVQQVAITGGPGGGTFTLTFNGQTTAGIAYNANAAAVQSALEALSNIDVGDVNVTGGALPGTPVLVEFRGQYAQTNVNALTADGSGLTGGAGPAVVITTPTAGVAPTALSLIPIAPGQVSVYMDATSGAIGTSKLLRDFVVEWSIGGRFNPVWPLNAALASFDAVIEAKPTTGLKLTMGNDATGRALLATMRAGDTKYVRVEAVGPEIEAGFNNRFRLDAAVKITAAPTKEEVEGLSVLSWQFQTFHDAAGLGKAFSVHLRNALTAL